jgi:hypothetical protein
VVPKGARREDPSRRLPDARDTCCDCQTAPPTAWATLARVCAREMQPDVRSLVDTPTLLPLLADEEEAKRKREDEVVPTETEAEAEQVEPVAKVQAIGDDAPTKATAAPESGDITGTPTPVLHSQPAAVVAEVA